MTHHQWSKSSAQPQAAQSLKNSWMQVFLLVHFAQLCLRNKTPEVSLDDAQICFEVISCMASLVILSRAKKASLGFGNKNEVR